jgi:uncharacterized protein (TIGR02594 family)
MLNSFLFNQQFIWFIGRVIDVNDPDEAGRIKVKAVPFYDSIDDDLIPWAQVMQPIQSAAKDGIGISPTGIQVDSAVIGFFLDGKYAQQPFVLGTFGGKGDVSGYAKQKTPERVTLPPIGFSPSSAADPVYTDNKVLKTSSGHVIEIDDTPQNERILIFHKSGSSVEINSSGRFVLRTVGDSYDLTAKNKISYTGGNVTFYSNGFIDIKSNQPCYIQSTSNCYVVSNDTIHLQAPNIELNYVLANTAEGTSNVPNTFLRRLTREQERSIESANLEFIQSSPFNQAMGFAGGGGDVILGPEDTTPQCGPECSDPNNNNAYKHNIVGFLEKVIADANNGLWRENGSSEARENIMNTYKSVGFQVAGVQTPWCAAFVGYVLRSTCYKYHPTLAAAGYDNYGDAYIQDNHQAAQQLIRTGSVQRGDIVVFDRVGGTGHVAFFWGYERVNDSLIWVGGNQSNNVTINRRPLSTTNLRSVRKPVEC